VFVLKLINIYPSLARAWLQYIVLFLNINICKGTPLLPFRCYTVKSDVGISIVYNKSEAELLYNFNSSPYNSNFGQNAQIFEKKLRFFITFDGFHVFHRLCTFITDGKDFCACMNYPVE